VLLASWVSLRGLLAYLGAPDARRGVKGAPPARPSRLVAGITTSKGVFVLGVTAGWGSQGSQFSPTGPPPPQPTPVSARAGFGPGRWACGYRRAHPIYQAVAIIEKRHPRRPPGSGLGKRPGVGHRFLLTVSKTGYVSFQQIGALFMRRGEIRITRRHVINLMTPRK
jgi:hypothetical protein